MNIDIENLPDDPATLKKMLSQVMSRNQYLEEQFRIAQHKQFGKSTEGHPGQGELFNEADELVVEAETAEETISYTRKKPVRKPLPKDLPREVIFHDIESIRVFRRLIILRELANEQKSSVFPRSPRASSSHGFDFRT